MKAKNICQSCFMAMSNMADRGTEKDGSKSNDYCKYCYQHGIFTEPGLTLEKMKLKVARIMTTGRQPNSALQQAIAILPGLKRWQKNNTDRVAFLIQDKAVLLNINMNSVKVQVGYVSFSSV